MSVISRITLAVTRLELKAKKALLDLIQTQTLAALGTTLATAAPILANRVVVTGADGTKGVVLPKAEQDASVEIVNTVSNQTLKVYPNISTDQINAITAGVHFSLVGGARGQFYCDAAGHWYVAAANLTGTSTSSTTAELDTLAGVTAGTTVASKAVVLDANKSADLEQVTTSRTLGGTGVPGAAATQTEIVKAVTGLTDTTATDVFTVTVPNAAHNAVIEVDCLGVLGAGGSIGAGESSMATKYRVTLARTAGVNVVAGVSTVIGAANANVAGGQAITSVVVTTSSISGAVGASNTFTIKVAITRSGAGATNHTLLATARIMNKNATGVTIA